MKVAKNAIIDVVRARIISGHKVKIWFSDGASRTVDFQPFLKSSQNPSIRAFLISEKFSKFTVHDGDLMWGDFEMCFPIADLYEGGL